MRHEKFDGGMTLSELMLVVAVLAVVASIALPSYSRLVRRTNRTDATMTMQTAAKSLERCYSRVFRYTACNVNGTVMNNGSTMQTPNQLYTITFTIPDNQHYMLTAEPAAAPQTKDNRCVLFTLSSSGAQTAQDINANDTTKRCWDSN